MKFDPFWLQSEELHALCFNTEITYWKYWFRMPAIQKYMWLKGGDWWNVGFLVIFLLLCPSILPVSPKLSILTCTSLPPHFRLSVLCLMKAYFIKQNTTLKAKIEHWHNSYSSPMMTLPLVKFYIFDLISRWVFLIWGHCSICQVIDWS